MKVSKLVSSLVGAALATVAPVALASHIWVTDPSVNGVSLDSPTGFTNPTISATVGSTLDIWAGFYDYCGGSCSETWTMHLNQTGGTLALGDLSAFITPGAGVPLYFSFSQLLSTVGTWTGFLEPIQNESCPSYRYGSGIEGGGGCGSPSESIPFSLNVTGGQVPEPGSLALLGLGALAIFGLRRRNS